jgi:transaldolase
MATDRVVSLAASLGSESAIGSVPRARRQGHGPTIWLAGEPEDLKEWMPLGAAGIVTNTVVLNQYAEKHGGVVDLIKKYLDITDKPVVMEIDGYTVEELLEVGKVFTSLSDQVILKIPCSVIGLKAFSALKEDGVETFCTTVFSLTQAAAVAQAGVDHILPFCEPVKEVGGDPTRLIRECATMFAGWEQRPFIMAALVRTVETATAAFRDGADELVTMWTVYRDMMDHPLTAQWNKIFMDEWLDMHEKGLLKGVPVKPHSSTDS